VIYGLLAAVGFGLADFLTAITTRRIGTFVTLLVSQLAGLTLLLGIIAFAHPSMGGADVREWVLMILGGVAAGIGYFALYKGLELGPIALVSPIIAADAAFAVVLFVVALHETLTAPQATAISITIAGVVFASFDPRRIPRDERQGPSGIPYAFVSVVFFSLGLFAAGYYARSFGWFLPAFTSRIGTMGVLVTWLAITRGRDLHARPPGRYLALAVAIGVADLGGLLLFTRGVELGLASIVTAASATFPLIPIAGGLLLFHERPAATQLAGVGLVIAGLVALGLVT
jgi:drug/metabolite transporter (DMT)-like permease